MTSDSVHLDLVLAADEEIDRQLEAADAASPVETIVWRDGMACPRGAFEARALQRGFTFVRPYAAPCVIREDFSREPREDFSRETRWAREDPREY